MNSNDHTIQQHFDNRAPEVKTTYFAILKSGAEAGPGAGGSEEDVHSSRQK